MDPNAIDPPGKLSPQVILAFLFGVIFISIILYVAMNVPESESFKKMVILVILSLAAGGIGGILPGYIVTGAPNKLVRAGGALAVFLVVLYFGSRYIQDPIDPAPYKPSTDPSVVANMFGSYLDTNKYDQAYELTSSSFKAGINKYPFTETSKRIEKKLGPANERSMIFQNVVESPPGLPKGYYCFTNYVAKHGNSTRDIYTNVVLIGEKEVSDWRVSSIFYAIKDNNGNFIPIDFTSSTPP